MRLPQRGDARSGDARARPVLAIRRAYAYEPPDPAWQPKWDLKAGKPAQSTRQEVFAVGQHEKLIVSKPIRDRKPQQTRDLLAPVVLPPPASQQGGAGSEAGLEEPDVPPTQPRQPVRLACLTCLQCLAPNATAALLSWLSSRGMLTLGSKGRLDETGSTRIDRYFAGADPSYWVDYEHQREPSHRDKHSLRKDVLWAPPGANGAPLRRRGKAQAADPNSVVRPTRLQNEAFEQEHDESGASSPSRTSIRGHQRGSLSKSCVGRLCELLGGVLYGALEALDDAVHRCTAVNLDSDTMNVKRTFQGALQEHKRRMLEQAFRSGLPSKERVDAGVHKLMASIGKAQQVGRNQRRDFRDFNGFDTY